MELCWLLCQQSLTIVFLLHMFCRWGIPSMLVIHQCKLGWHVNMIVQLRQVIVPAWQVLEKSVPCCSYLFYLESVCRVNTTCTQTAGMWKEPRLVETIPYARIMGIPFTKPKGSISTNRKRGAHLYSDSVPLADLPQQTQEDQDSCMLELVVN